MDEPGQSTGPSPQRCGNDRADRLGEVPTLRPEWPAVPPDTPVRSLGDYELLEEIARGPGRAGHGRSLELLGEAARMKFAPEVRAEAVLAAASPGIRAVCRLGPRRLLIHGEGPYIVFRPDGHLIATSDTWDEREGPDRGTHKAGISVWQLPSGQPLRRVECDYDGGNFVFSAAPPLMALRQTPRIGDSSRREDGGLRGEAGVVHLWDVAAGHELVFWQAHDTGLTALTFSPDGHTLVSGSADGTLKLWDLPGIRKELAAVGLDW